MYDNERFFYVDIQRQQCHYVYFDVKYSTQLINASALKLA